MGTQKARVTALDSRPQPPLPGGGGGGAEQFSTRWQHANAAWAREAARPARLARERRPAEALFSPLGVFSSEPDGNSFLNASTNCKPQLE